MSLKDLALKPNHLSPGHRTCAGCGIPPIVRTVLRAVDRPVVVACATGCLEVTTTIYPYTSWEVPFIHSAFENAAATASGICAALDYLIKKRTWKGEKPAVIAFAGDGGTYDIGLQSLSGAIERGHDFLYICYNNGAYMNTGVQRSSATPHGASTTTSPAGKVIPGKVQFEKPLTQIIAAHNIPYVAQASVSHLLDLANKVKKAVSIEGPKFINVLQPCTLGWRYPADMTIEIARLAVETRFWPLYEIESGQKPKITVNVPKPKPIEEFLKLQGRFKHLFREENKHIIGEIRKHIDREWERLMS